MMDETCVLFAWISCWNMSQNTLSVERLCGNDKAITYSLEVFLWLYTCFLFLFANNIDFFSKYFVESCTFILNYAVCMLFKTVLFALLKHKQACPFCQKHENQLFESYFASHFCNMNVALVIMNQTKSFMNPKGG